MKLYDFAQAPSPRRVRIFAAEKGIVLDTISVDLMNREQFEPAYRQINPRCTVPMLVLDDGTAISEVPAICLYLEETYPEPRLLGRDTRDRALVAMWDRRMELDGYLAAADAVRNTLPRLVERALVGPHDYAQIPALAERSRLRIAHFVDDLEMRLAESPYVAGDTFTIADITAFVALDFFAARLEPAVPEGSVAVRRWQATVRARPSMAA